ncbi:MAG: hypothetical protein SYC29_08540 [Planctomycetota bacterium]|nr:hypothetical protein [Planctomycetota bacterium]
MKQDLPALVTGLAVMLAPLAASAAEPIDEVLRELNGTRSVQGSTEIKSYPILFEAYLNLEPPPMEIGPDFNHATIHPGMPDWDAVSGWAESNPEMVDAILACEGKTLFGLPYGSMNVQRQFREAELMAEIGAEGSLRNNRFPYLRAIDVISAFATAEAYRLLESRDIQEGLDLAMAKIFVLRQCCDREFLAEQLHSIAMLSDALANLRDMFWLYEEQITADQYAEIAIEKLPFLRPDRARLFMPEGDRVVSEALIREVFTARGQPDREKFARTFAAIQSEDAPLTRFGAARRWAKVAEVHDSEEASLDRLQLVYDDWWRRWRVQEYDPILSIRTQFERTNPIRYAAVIYSMQNIEELFGVRNELMASVYGTAMAAGVAGYYSNYGTYPVDSDMTYAQFVRKRSDRDPFDLQFLPFKYYVADERRPIDTLAGRIFVEEGCGILYSRGKDNEDDRAREHTDSGEAGDIVMWPPIKALQREQGLID